MKSYTWCFFDITVSNNWLDQSICLVLKQVLDGYKLHLFNIRWGLKEHTFLLLLFRIEFWGLLDLLDFTSLLLELLLLNLLQRLILHLRYINLNKLIFIEFFLFILEFFLDLFILFLSLVSHVYFLVSGNLYIIRFHILFVFLVLITKRFSEHVLLNLLRHSKDLNLIKHLNLTISTLFLGFF